MLRIFGDEVPLRAQVEVLTGYSAHADRGELRRWLDAVRDGGAQQGRTNPLVCLVHGEPEAQTDFAGTLRKGGYRVEIGTPGQRISL